VEGLKLGLVLAGVVIMAACSGSHVRPSASPVRSLSAQAARERAAGCAHPTATGATYRATPVGSSAVPRVGPLTFSPSPYQLRFPDKVLIHRVGVFSGPLSLTGYNCRDGRVLRFWYRIRASLPAGAIRGRTEGDRAAVLRFNRQYPDYLGYMLFTEPGKWNVVVSHGTAVIGNIVIVVATRRP
jgi:hypothetical protein